MHLFAEKEGYRERWKWTSREESHTTFQDLRGIATDGDRWSSTGSGPEGEGRGHWLSNGVGAPGRAGLHAFDGELVENEGVEKVKLKELMGGMSSTSTKAITPWSRRRFR